MVDSKEQLLSMILDTYVSSVTAGWKAVLAVPAPAPWRSWTRCSGWTSTCSIASARNTRSSPSSLQFVAPPTSPNLGLAFPSQLRQMRRLLTDAAAAAELHVLGLSADMRARCVYSLIWTPENIIRHLGTRAALEFSRQTLLWGAAVRAWTTACAEPERGGSQAVTTGRLAHPRTLAVCALWARS